MRLVTPIGEIEHFQINRGLDKLPFDNLNEHVNIVEELLETMGFDIPKENRAKLKELWSSFVNETLCLNIAGETSNDSTVDKVDAFGDIIVFAVGAIMKLGYNPSLVLLEIGKEINSREGEMIDGKFTKFLTPETKVKWYKADFTKCKKG